MTRRRCSAPCTPQRHDDRVDGITLSAGITELAERDDAQSALGRAEHALWQAKQAGRGTIVVAVPGRRGRSTGNASLFVHFGKYSAIGVPRSRLHPPFRSVQGE